MSSRRDRRAGEAAKARFRRKAGHGLITGLVPAGTPLDRRDQYGAVLSRALADWYRAPSFRCFCCHRAGEVPGAFLYSAAAVRPSTASLSICCNICVTKPIAEIEIAAERVLRKIIPNGRFEPLPADTS